MSLPNAIQNARRPSLLLTWYRSESTTPEDLTDATLTGVIRAPNHVKRAIAGTLTITDGENGEFRWDLAAGDVVAAGTFRVQFTASFASGQSPAKTFETSWVISPALTVEVP